MSDAATVRRVSLGRTIAYDEIGSFRLITRVIHGRYRLILINSGKSVAIVGRVSRFGWIARWKHRRFAAILRRSIIASVDAPIWQTNEPTFTTGETAILDLKTLPSKEATLLKLKYG